MWCIDRLFREAVDVITAGYRFLGDQNEAKRTRWGTHVDASRAGRYVREGGRGSPVPNGRGQSQTMTPRPFLRSGILFSVSALGLGCTSGRPSKPFSGADFPSGTAGPPLALEEQRAIRLQPEDNVLGLASADARDVLFWTPAGTFLLGGSTVRRKVTCKGHDVRVATATRRNGQTFVFDTSVNLAFAVLPSGKCSVPHSLRLNRPIAAVVTDSGWLGLDEDSKGHTHLVFTKEPGSKPRVRELPPPSGTTHCISGCIWQVIAMVLSSGRSNGLLSGLG